jgi:Domain of unknown function (DUF6265)
MRRRILLGASLLTFFCGWTFQQDNKIQKAEWLIGSWVNKTQRGDIYETWTKLTAFEFSGKTYLLKEKDTVVLETVQLVEEANTLLYIPVVKNQNGGLPVRFTAKTVSDSVLVFQNLEHDFPQVISYTRINADSLMAEISGTKNGIKRSQKFPMKRVK